ncbi:phage tail tape measure protein, partial [Bacillus sp. SIMBA_005]|uniref:phage tail tape measure protein n=1 Tax=Bacillus sp. SIMBA_005 TaxID=3085754 RepID=UPI00397D2EDC
AKNTEFDAAMSNVRAATMATAEEQRALGEAALDAGADTAYSASEAAAAQEELAKAGLSVSSVIGGSLNGALALAAAGQLQVARSAEI